MYNDYYALMREGVVPLYKLDVIKIDEGYDDEHGYVKEVLFKEKDGSLGLALVVNENGKPI